MMPKFESTFAECDFTDYKLVDENEVLIDDVNDMKVRTASSAFTDTTFQIRLKNN